MSDQKKSRSKTADADNKSSRSKSRAKSSAQADATSDKQGEAYQVVLQPLGGQQGGTGSVICENCSKPAETFCATCDSILCSSCFDVIHANPALKHHIKQSPQLLQLFTKQCNYHPNQRCRLVCLTCNVFICNLCKTSSHIGHNIMQVQDAFTQQVMRLQQMITGTGLVQAKVSQEIQKYEQMEQRISDNELRIKQRLNQQVEELLNNLNLDKTQKMMLIQPDKVKMQSKLNYLNWAIQTVNSLSCGRLDELNLMVEEPKQLNPIFQEHINVTIKPPTAQSNIFTVLHQIEQQLKDIQTFQLPTTPNFDTNLRDVSINSVSGNSLEAKELLISKLTRQLNDQEQQYSTELTKWMQLTENYANVLQNHQLCCAFCGAKMSQKAANGLCSCNTFVDKDSVEAVRRAERVVERDGDISVEQAVQVIGNGRHYWTDAQSGSVL